MDRPAGTGAPGGDAPRTRAGAWVVAGVLLAALAAARIGIPIAADRPLLLVLVAVLGVAAVALARRPYWIVPGYLGLVWTLVPASTLGGLSPIELGGVAMLGLAIWRAPTRPDLALATALVIGLAAIPLATGWATAQIDAGLPTDQLRDLAFVAIAAFGLASVGDVDRAIRAIAVVGLALGIGALYSVYVAPTGLFPLETDPAGVEAARAAGPFGESNFFALSLAATAPMQYFVAIRGGVWRYVGAAGLIAVLGGIIAAGSRGGMIAALAGIGLCVVFSGSLGESGRRVRLIGAVAVVGVALLVPTLSAQVQSSTQRTVSGRATENRIAVAMFADHPLLGVGPGVYPLLYRDYARDIGNDPRREREPHNLYLQILSEQGIVGALGWLGAAFIVGAAVVRRRLWASPAGMAVLFSLASYGVGSLFLHGANLRLLYILVGMALALAYAPTAREDAR